MTSAQLTEFYAGLCKEFPIVTIEDGYDQDDWTGWCTQSETHGAVMQIVG